MYDYPPPPLLSNLVVVGSGGELDGADDALALGQRPVLHLALNLSTVCKHASWF